MFLLLNCTCKIDARPEHRQFTFIDSFESFRSLLPLNHLSESYQVNIEDILDSWKGIEHVLLSADCLSFEPGENLNNQIQTKAFGKKSDKEEQRHCFVTGLDKLYEYNIDRLANELNLDLSATVWKMRFMNTLKLWRSSSGSGGSDM